MKLQPGQRTARFLVTALLLGLCQFVVSPQLAYAGSVNFGADGSGSPTNGTVTIPYNEKFEIGDGAFNLEMWVKETSRVGYENGVRVGQDQQYQAQFFSGSKHFDWNDCANKSSWGIGVTFDPGIFYIATQVGQQCGTPAYAAGIDNGLEDTQTSNTKTQLDAYNTFADLGWHHIAFSKTGSGGTLSGYLDGVRVLYAPNDNSIFSMNGGDILLGGSKFVGQIADVRLVKGQALYTGPSITVPTSQITTTSQGAIASNVSLLLKASGTICAVEDVSDNHFQVLLNGATCTAVTSRAITSYNVQFDNQGHGTKPADANGVTSIALADLPPESTDGNFTFKGWSETTTGAVLTGAYTVSADSTLYAIWEDNRSTSTISYDLNYLGSLTAPTQAPVAQGSTFEVAANPIRSGYQFMGWTDNGANNGRVYGGPSYISKTYTVGASNITLTANWESLSHRIVRTVHQNGNPDVNIIGGYYGGGVHTGIDVAPGWCVVSGTNADRATWLVTEVTHDPSWEVFTVSPSSARFAYGEAYQFSPDPLIAFTTGESQTVTVGTPITSTATNNTGCQANKYSITPTLPLNLALDTATGIISGTPSATQSSIPYTLTAERWVDANGNLDISGTKIGYSSATFTLQVTTPHGAVPNIVGLSTAAATTALSPNFTLGTSTGTTGFGATTLNNGKIASQSITGDQLYGSVINYTTYVYVASSYTVNYDLAGGRYEPKKSTPIQSSIAPGTVIKLANSKELQKTGYTFGGWSDNSRTYAAGASYTMGNSNVVFTAVWIAKQYKITWNIRTNGGTSGGTGGASNYTVGNQILTLASNASRPSATFKGWYTAAKGGTKVTSGYLVPNPFGDVTLYAQFL